MGDNGLESLDPLLAKRIVSYLKACSHIQISSLRTRSCPWVYKRNLKKYLKNLGASTTSVGAFLVEEDTMQIKELKAKTKESDNKTPTPPNDPVALSRWVQVTHNYPKPPRKQPDDPALTPTPIKKPIPNNVIGTDKPKRKKPKKANAARTTVPSYLRVPTGVPASQVKNIGHGRGVLKFMQWYSTNQSDMRLEKLDASQLACFGLGCYISDIPARDEKQK